MASQNPDHAFRRHSNQDKKKRVAKKYVGLNDEEIEKKRLRNNELERIRQHAIQASFSKLDGVIPDHMKIHKDGSRLSTLDNASYCIEQVDRKVNYCYQILRADPKHQRLANFLNEGNIGNKDVGVMVRNIGYGGSQNQAHVDKQGNQKTNENLDTGNVKNVSCNMDNGYVNIVNHNIGNGPVNTVNHNFGNGTVKNVNHNLNNGPLK
ncbi:hypothetical protein EGW08_020367 [Elysia chlorotica]|uniref:BHLH domain-containing protein n=1 Tax=Elysia chlorotica TaxID=188477 RepID=A0A3S0ZCL5_ELYCH|nr:hypothetical protein EGW08_020367 [Elysia chlorotica]